MLIHHHLRHRHLNMFRYTMKYCFFFKKKKNTNGCLHHHCRHHCHSLARSYLPDPFHYSYLPTLCGAGLESPPPSISGSSGMEPSTFPLPTDDLSVLLFYGRIPYSVFPFLVSYVFSGNLHSFSSWPSILSISTSTSSV